MPQRGTPSLCFKVLEDKELSFKLEGVPLIPSLHFKLSGLQG